MGNPMGYHMGYSHGSHGISHDISHGISNGISHGISHWKFHGIFHGMSPWEIQWDIPARPRPMCRKYRQTGIRGWSAHRANDNSVCRRCPTNTCLNTLSLLIVSSCVCALARYCALGQQHDRAYVDPKQQFLGNRCGANGAPGSQGYWQLLESRDIYGGWGYLGLPLATCTPGRQGCLSKLG